MGRRVTLAAIVLAVAAPVAWASLRVVSTPGSPLALVCVALSLAILSLAGVGFWQQHSEVFVQPIPDKPEPAPVESREGAFALEGWSE